MVRRGEHVFLDSPEWPAKVAIAGELLEARDPVTDRWVLRQGLERLRQSERRPSPGDLVDVALENGRAIYRLGKPSGRILTTYPAELVYSEGPF